jgi:hypothetical protein
LCSVGFLGSQSIRKRSPSFVPNWLKKVYSLSTGAEMTFKILVSAILFTLVGCGGSADKLDGGDSGEECEIHPDADCTPADSGGEATCPEGYSCSGLSAYLCYKGTCNELPICLPGSTQIGTPKGDMALESLKVGAPIWTRNAQGDRIAARVEKVASVRAPNHHKVLQMTLADGRSFTASPGHPDTQGKALRDYRVGDVLDGSAVREKTLVNYDRDRTWDVFPSGPTGDYLANGVWLGSTLTGGASVSQK